MTEMEGGGGGGGGAPNIQVVLVSPKDVFDPIFFHGNEEARRWLNAKAASLWVCWLKGKAKNTHQA